MLLVLQLLAACSDSGRHQTLAYTDAHTYQADLEVELPVLDVRAGADVALDWSSLAQDLRGGSAAAADVTGVALVSADMDIDQLAERFVTQQLEDDAVSAGWVWPAESGETSMSLSELVTWGDEPFVPQDQLFGPSAGGAEGWLVIVGLEEGEWPPIAAFGLQPLQQSEVTVVDVGSGLGSVSVQADLQPGPPLVADASAELWTVDWTAVTADAWGGSVDPTELRAPVLVHSPLDVAAIGASLLDLPDHVDALYRMPVMRPAGTPAAEHHVSADGRYPLTLLVEQDSGERFDGFTTTGTWMLAVFEGGGSSSQDLNSLPPVGVVIEVEQ